MEEAEIEESESMPLNKSAHNPEIVSIRKKLAAPNNILPGAMIRSQLPVHLLPVRHDFQSESGQQMLLDEVGEDTLSEKIDKIGSYRSKKHIFRTNKPRSKSQISAYKVKEQPHSTQVVTSFEKNTIVNDPLDFLCRCLKNILSYPHNILFVSKTALLGNVKASSLKSKIVGAKQSEETNNRYLKYLSNLSLFGVTPYAYDQFNSYEMAQIPKFQSRDEDLQFDDDFQSSNLYLAMAYPQHLTNKFRREGQKYDKVYMGTVRLDYNTKSYGQWFYFKIKRKGREYSFSRQGSCSNFYKFMIVNMTKSSSMFGKGLKVSVCRKGVWRKEGMNIRYYKNSLRRQDLPNSDSPIFTPLKQQACYYTLQFTIQIFENEELYISYNQPYTYTRLGNLLDKVTSLYEQNKRNIIDIKRHVLCQTYLNNNIEVINFAAKNSQSHPQKNVIFIIGRCHPVETAGSHVAEGIINKLCSLFIQNPIDQQRNHIIYKLLQRYVLKIIPMANPDGVILGNSRCNLAGYDLNRSWRNAKADRCRQIYELKRYILQHQNRIAMFIDLHAHSKKKNVFAYGCHDISDPFATREFPFLLSKLSENDFIFSQCRFTPLTGRDRQKGSKDGTARVFLYDVLRIPNVFTIENSYCSAKNSLFHYDRTSYEIIGGDILKAISLYFSPTFRNSQKWQADKESFLLESQRSANDSLRVPQETKKQEASPVINISLNAQTISNISFNVNISREESVRDSKGSNFMSLRDRYLRELRSKEDNITVGLLKDDVSESEEEERVYEQVSRNNQQSNSLSARKHKKQSKTSQKIINYLNRTKQPRQTKKDHSTSKNQHLRADSSAHSEINLVKVTNTTKYNRFHTVSKHQEESQWHASTQPQKMESPSMTYLGKKKKEMEDSIFRQTKKERQLSIIEIGLDGEAGNTHNYRINIGQKMEGKFSRPLHHRDQSPPQVAAFKYEAERYLNRKREQEIKDYLRRLVRPKQILERRYRLACRQERQDKKEMKIKYSNIEFAEGRLTRLLSNQCATPRLYTEHVGQ